MERYPYLRKVIGSSYEDIQDHSHVARPFLGDKYSNQVTVIKSSWQEEDDVVFIPLRPSSLCDESFDCDWDPHRGYGY